MRVLIVDSDEEFLEILQSFLTKHGHETEIASNGLECMEILRVIPPEVLVLDDELLWGGYDDIMTLMSEDPDLSQIPTILIGDDNPHHCLSLSLLKQVFKTLRKPFHLAELEMCIDAAGRSTKAGIGPLRSTSGTHLPIARQRA